MSASYRLLEEQRLIGNDRSILLFKISWNSLFYIAY